MQILHFQYLLAYYIALTTIIIIELLDILWKPGVVAMQWLQFNTRVSTQV